MAYTRPGVSVKSFEPNLAAPLLAICRFRFPFFISHFEDRKRVHPIFRVYGTGYRLGIWAMSVDALAGLLVDERGWT